MIGYFVVYNTTRSANVLPVAEKTGQRPSIPALFEVPLSKAHNDASLQADERDLEGE